MRSDKPIKNLAAKLLAVMGDVSYVQKTGWNSFHKFKYVKEADLIGAMSEALRKHRVFLFTSVVERNHERYTNVTRYETTIKGLNGAPDKVEVKIDSKKYFLVSIKVKYTFVDADSGESFSGYFYGDGQDSGDKGIYKAMTGCAKYLLLKNFLIESGDDPEMDEEERKHAPQKSASVSNATPDIAPGIRNMLITKLENAAKFGKSTLKAEWDALTKDERVALQDNLERIKKLCPDQEKTNA